MNLDCVDLKALKAKQGKERESVIAQYERQKAHLIDSYLVLQDKIDEYNRRIYLLTCDIEKINLILKEMH